MDFSSTFRPHSGAKAFFLSIFVWGIGVGCFSASLNNFLVDMYQMDSVDRGWLELFRELPGLMLVFLFAILHRISDWRIIRLGTLASMIGAALLLVPSNKICVTGTIMIWSLGEHLIMPCRQLLAMKVAQPGHEGKSLGFLTSVMNLGHVLGSVITAGVFILGARFSTEENPISDRLLFGIVWGIIIVLLVISVCSTFVGEVPDVKAKRPTLYFNWKFNKFYALELFYGARKQIFLTFAPYVMIRIYGFSTAAMATLLGICAITNIFAAPMVGKLTDKLGYRTIMIWDTIILAGVCVLYGFADKFFPMNVALVVVCVNFLLDAIISTTSLATNVYVREVADSTDELSSTLSTGISINHLISIIVAPLGGWVWVKYGVGMLFVFSATMAIFNSIFAWTLPKHTIKEQK